jgi:Tol biopolymer transport system component
MLAGILVFAACRHSFIRNPNLRFLRSDVFSVEHPAVAPNGTEVYYLSGNTLWKLNVNNDSASLVRAGWFQAIALSPDGTRLALLGHDLLLADTAGAILQTLVPSESVGEDPVDVQFSHDGSFVYYSIGSQPHGADYYRVALDGTGRKLVHQSCGTAESPSGRTGFALTRNDSILEFFSSRAWPELSPIDDNVMAYSSNWWFNGDVHIVYLSSDSGFSLDCNPYSDSRIAYPSWFPDGHKLVFCATDSGLVQHYQLWMLDSVEY